MSVTREARHLAGHDIGKTITHNDTTGTLWGLTHQRLGKHPITIVFLDIGEDPTGATRILYLQPADHVTITGTPSPTLLEQNLEAIQDEIEHTEAHGLCGCDEPPAGTRRLVHAAHRKITLPELYAITDDLQANLDRHATHTETSTP